MKYKISEIGKVVGGGTPSTKHAEYYSKNGIAWITPKDLSDYHKKYIGHGAKDISEEGLKNSSAKLLPVDSILVSSRAPIGYVAMAGTDLATSQGFKSIVPNTSKVMPEYLYFLMLKSKDKLEQIASGSTFKEISGKEMSNFTVDIPALKEQKEIVQKLNPIFKKIEENNRINDNLLELVDTLFDNIIKCSILYKATLNDIGTIVGGGTPSKKVNVYWNGKIPWLTPKDLSKSHSIFTSKGTRFITEYGLKESSARLFPTGTVLFSSRAPIGYISIAKNNISTSQGFKSIIPNKGYSPEFIYELLKKETPLIIREANGSTFKEISGTRLKAHIVNIPSKAKAKYFDNSALAIFKLISKNENENKILKNLKKELLNKIFWNVKLSFN